MIKAFFRYLFSLILKIVDWVLGMVLSILPFDITDKVIGAFTNLGSNINHFYGVCMNYFTLARAFFDISSFEMQLIAELLAVKLLYKPLLIVVKLVVKWIKALK